MNRYPVWKYVLIVIALLLGALYTAPNYFVESPALQVTTGKATLKVNADTAARVETVLKAAGIKEDMGFITTQIGMFSYSGLAKNQMVRLRNEFGVYGTDTGRMCVAALNSKNIDYVCASIAKVI